MDKIRVIDSKRLEKKCTVCNKVFSIPKCRDWREHECSSECKKEKRSILKNSKEKECLICKSKFQPRNAQIKNGGGNYCSTRCFYDSRIGLKNTVETKQKRVNSFLISEYNKNRPKGKNHPLSKEFIMSYGYVWIWNEEGKKVQMHRHVVEKYLGRKLESNEIVHHKDRNKLNNSIENLEIMTRSEHLIEHLPEILLNRAILAR